MELVCLACRRWSEGRIDLRTLEPVDGGAALACVCGQRYPVVDGVPVISPHEPAAATDDDDPDTQAARVADLADDDPYARQVEHLSIYLDAHWGDRAAPPPAEHGPAAAFGLAPLLARVRATPGRVARAVELGSSVGRVLAELADAADEVVGIELNVGAARRARRLLAGERVSYNRRIAGKHYAPAAATGLARPSVRVVAADALDPPLVPGWFGRVVALNLLDSVPGPRQLLAVMHGLCAPGGELILSSPYAWQTAIVPDGERLGGADPAAALVELLEGGELGARYAIEEEADVPWHLRRDARSTVTYRAHYLRARRM